MKKQVLLGLALTSLTTGCLAIASQATLAQNLKSFEVGNNIQTIIEQKPVLVSVSPNWQSKLRSVSNKIIGQLESKLGSLAMGNQGSARVEALRAEGSNLYVKVLIHHKHEPKRKLGIPQGIPYSAQTWIETRYNPLNSKSLEDSTKLCVKGPKVVGSPNMCITAREVRQIISASL